MWQIYVGQNMHTHRERKREGGLRGGGGGSGGGWWTGSKIGAAVSGEINLLAAAGKRSLTLSPLLLLPEPARVRGGGSSGGFTRLTRAHGAHGHK